MNKHELILNCLNSGRYKVLQSGEILRYRKNKQCYLPISKNNINGYKQIVLFNGRNTGLKVSTYLHIAIYLYFNGLYDINLHIDHIDGDKTNNCLTNLQAISAKQNTIKANKPKLKTIKLNKAESILNLFDLYKQGLTQYAASKQTGVNRLTVRYIFNKFKNKQYFKYANIAYE